MIPQSKRKSLTLVEVLVAAAILSFGVIMVSQGFIVALDGFTYSIEYLDTLLWMDWKLMDLHHKLAQYPPQLEPDDQSGVFIMKNKRFKWELTFHEIEKTESTELYELTMRVLWGAGMRRAQALRTVYALYVIKKTT